MKSLAIEKEKQLIPRKDILAFFMMMSAKAGLNEKIRRDNVLAKRITHDDVFDVTSRSLALHQTLANTDSPFLDKEMQNIWRMFTTQDDDVVLEYFELANEISHWKYRRAVSSISRVEYSLQAGTPTAYVGGETGFFIQDLLTIPGSRDPFTLSSVGETSTIREYSPLVVLPKKISEKHWRIVTDLASSFVDTIAVLSEPVEVKMIGDDGGYEPAFENVISLSLSEHLSRMKRRGEKSASKYLIETPGRQSSWLGSGSMSVEIRFRGQTVFKRDGYDIKPVPEGRGFRVKNVSNAQFIRDAVFLAVENEYLKSLDRTRQAAEKAAMVAVDDLARMNPEMMGVVSAENLLNFTSLIYGTWVTGLLSLWRREASNKVANYIQGR